jgi:phage tail tape-measure protein
MADLRYTVDVDTRGAKQSLTGLKSTIAGVGAALGVAFGTKEIVQISARFEDLRTTLGFLFGDVDTGAKAFDQIKKFATESIFTVEDLTNSIVKLKAAGLTPSIEQLRLFADVSSVATDSVGALQAITDLFARTTAGGLGLEDLNRLADRGIPVFDILQKKLGLARLEVSEFGKTAEGAQILLAALTEGLEETFSGASAARANNLSQAFSNLEDAVANTADVIGQAGLNKALGDAIRRITELIENNKALIKNLTEGLVNALVFVAENIKYVAGLLGGLFAAAVVGKIITLVGAVLKFADALKKAAIAGAILQGVTGVGLLKLAAGMVGVAATIASIEALSGDATESIKKVEEEIENMKNAAEGPLSFPEAPDAPEGGFETQLESYKQKQEAITRSAINYFDQYKNSVRDVQERVSQEGELLKLTESQAKVQRELNNFTQNYLNTIRPS